MYKKLSAIFIVLIIIASFSMNVFAGNADGSGNSTSSAIKRKYPGSSVTSQSAMSEIGYSTSDSAIERRISIKESNSADSAGAISDEEFEKALQKAFRNGIAIDNGEFIMEITSPDKDKDSTYKKTYILSGRSKHTDIIISIGKFNEDKGEYEPMYNTDGESSWEIGSTGVFSKEILLTKGTNKIKIMSYRVSQKDPSKFQINCFTIELLDEAIAERAVKKDAGRDIVGDSIKSIIELFGGKSK